MTSYLHRPAPTGSVISGCLRSRWWTLPFSAETWRRTFYILVAAPLTAVCIPLALLGGHRAAAWLQRRLACRLLALRADRPAPRDRAGRVLAHAVLSLPVNLASLALTAYLWAGVAVNVAFPLRPGALDSYQHSWGGPSLAGAWAVHAAGGLLFLFITPWIVMAITWLQGRLVERLLGVG